MTGTADAGRASFEHEHATDYTPWLGPLLPEIESIHAWPNQTEFRLASAIAVVLLLAVAILAHFV